MIALAGVDWRTEPTIDFDSLAADAAVIDRIRAIPPAADGLVLATCDRIERIVVADTIDESIDLDLLRAAGLPLSTVTYVLTDEVAVEHIFGITAGLRGPVFGEQAVINQVKQALAAARAAGTAGPVTTRLVDAALIASRQAREAANFALRNRRLGQESVAFLSERFGPLTGKTVAVLGTGGAAIEAVEALDSLGASIVLLNHDPQKAASLAARGARNSPLGELAAVLARADAVIATSRTSTPIIRPEHISRPLLIIDIATPPDTAPEVADIPGVTRFDAADVSPIQVVAKDLAHDALRPEVETFMAWLKSRSTLPALRELRDWANDSTALLVQRAIRDGQLTDSQRAIVDRLANSIVQKLLHGATVALRDADDAEAARILALLRRGRASGG